METAENCDFIHGLFERRLARQELDVPLLPEAAMRIMRASVDDAPNARRFADIIAADAALTMHVLRVASSPGKRPAAPVSSLAHAIAWLGVGEVANIAFTLALQGKMLCVPGQYSRARGYWRHALGSALWSKHIAQLLRADAGQAHLCGLLHEIGKPVTLGAVHELAQRAQTKLAAEEYERLIETFHRHVGAQVAALWGLPDFVVAASAQWEAYEAAGAARRLCNIVNLAHRLTDCAFGDASPLARDLLLDAQVCKDLGFAPEDAGALFDAAGAIGAELDSYLPA